MTAGRRSALRVAVRNGLAMDGALLVAVLLAATLWSSAGHSPLRTIATVLSLCVAPGWGLMRVWGARPSAFTAVAAIAISAALVMVVGLLFVMQLDWRWATAVNLLNLLAAACLLLSISRIVGGSTARPPADGS